MKPRTIESKGRYLWAFIIGTAIFILGFAITQSIAYLEYQRLSTLQDPISYKIFQDKLQFTLFDKDLCADESYVEISEDLRFHGSLLGDLEQKLGKNDEDVLFRKKFYSLILLEHFEMVKLINEKCENKSINTILFFYSNEDDDIEESEKLGSILGVLHERHKDNLVIYSFDVNLDSEIISSLKEKYNVTTPQKVIINEEKSFEKITNIKELEIFLN